MCGIVGFIDYNKKSDEEVLSNMTKTLYHRGPDDQGVSFYKSDNCYIGLGHRRLSILDLTKNGHQPMKYKSLEIVFNGEIYNFKELRDLLKSKGYQFYSNSDTEVLLKGFDLWNTKLFEKLNGMFSIAIFDHTSKELYLVRDRLGIKPLYIYFDNSLMMFSSELKAFHKNLLFKKDINNLGVYEYFKYGYNVDNNIFKYVFKLKPATFIKYTLKDKTIIEKKFWELKPSSNIKSLNNAKRELKKLLKESIKYRLISDVEVGSFLSGGYDSSLVSAIAQELSDKKIKTFTIGFDDTKFDESSYAKKVAKHIESEHIEYICKKEDFINMFNNLSFILDEPLADSSIIPTTIVSKLTSNYVKVALSGDGGDELFGGYRSYLKALAFKPSYLKRAVAGGLASLLNFTYNRKLSRLQMILNSKNIVDYHYSLAYKFCDIDLKYLLKSKIEYEFSFLKEFKREGYSHEDILTYKDIFASLPEQLLFKVDKSSMYHSLEVRVPLLDYNIVEFAFSLSNDLKFQNQGKFLLKELAYDYIPKNLLDRPKQGFSIPLKEWLSGNINDIFYKYTDESFIKRQNIFSMEFINHFVNSYKKGKFNSNQLWTFIVFQMWYDKWVESV